MSEIYENLVSFSNDPIPSINIPLPPLSARQFRRTLVKELNISLSAVDSAIDSIQDAAEKLDAQIDWEYATSFERRHPLIITLGAGFGLTSQQIDAAWLVGLAY